MIKLKIRKGVSIMGLGLTPTQKLVKTENLRVSPNHYKVIGKIHRKYETAIILPTYCEAKNIKSLIEKIENLKIDSLILVIDDSSPDGTAKKVEELQKKYQNIVLVIRPYKMGLGTAITDGFKIILSLKNKPKYVVTMDADFSHNPDAIPHLISLAKRGYDLVVGSRYCPGGKADRWGPIRTLISKIANRIASTILNIKVSDCTSGFRCYSTRLLKRIVRNLHSQTYEIQIETVRQAARKGFFIIETPITFVNRKFGKSKLTINEIMHFLTFMVKADLEHYFVPSMYKIVAWTQKNQFEIFDYTFPTYVELLKRLT